jgi:putative exosortase-associated protein (TIGR04073 family)
LLSSEGQEVTDMRTIFALLLAVPLAIPTVAAARTNGEDYGPVDKLSRGVANMTTGVLALPGTIMDKTREDGASGIPVGIGVGLARTVARELVGVYDFVTFPLPQPGNYAPAMTPAYPWEYFSEGTRHASSRSYEPMASRGSDASYAGSSGAYAARPQAQCLSESDVRDVQRHLNDMGYKAGPVDGLYGPQTRSALRSFQKDHSLEADGRIDVDTLAAMKLNRSRGEARSATSGTSGPSYEQAPRSSASSPQQRANENDSPNGR